MPHEPHSFQYDCDAIVFDLDGVLVDSRHCIERIWRAWASPHHINIDKVLHYARGRRAIETIRLVAPQLDAEHEAAELAAAEARETEGLVKIPGALELIQSRATATTRLAFGGLPVPEVLITAKDVNVGKPDPEPYLFAAMMLGVEPARCVVIEDAPMGIQAGRAAGMHVIGVISSDYTPEELHQAHVVVRKLGDIKVSQTQGTGLASLIVSVKAL